MSRICFALAALALCTPAHAQHYTYAKIAETDDVFSFVSSPAVNDLGTVAFRAGLVAGGEAMYTSNGGLLTLIADSSGPIRTFSRPSINRLPIRQLRDHHPT